MKQASSQQKPAMTVFEYALTDQSGVPNPFEMDCSAYALLPSCSTVLESSSTDSIHGRDLMNSTKLSHWRYGMHATRTTRAGYTCIEDSSDSYHTMVSAPPNGQT